VPLSSTKVENKNCELCGRKIEWRARWAKNWDEIKFCSDQCRRSKKTKHLGFEEKILTVLVKRPASSTICPSEVLEDYLKQDPEHMELVRQAARRLVHQGKILILQKGREVDPSDFRGPIRLKLKRDQT
jgi:hypothetical protein